MRALLGVRALPLLASIACSSAAVPPPARSSSAPLLFQSGPQPDGSSLAYNGGYVMEPRKNVYAIWYGAWGGSATPGIVQDFLQHVGGSPYFKMNELYYDFTGSRVLNAITLAGSTTVAGYTHGQNLQPGGVYAIVQDQLDNGVFPADGNGIYVVFTSQEVTETNGFGTLCTPPKNGGYGGYHSHQAYGSTDVKYALVGSPASTTCAPLFSWSSQGASGPNGLEPDGMVNIAAHEIFEASQDPNGDAWANNPGTTNSVESGDICLWTVGREGVYSTGAGGAVANVRLGDRDYLVQGNWQQTPFGGCDARVDLARPNAAHGHTTQDFNGDGMADVLWQDSSNGNLSMWLMFGSFPSIKQAIVDIPNDFHFYGTGDFDGDKNADFVIRDEQNGNFQVWLMNGTTHTSTLGATPGSAQQLIGIGDIGGTGHDQLLVRAAGPTARILAVSPQSGSQALVDTSGNFALPPWDMQLAGTGDFDADGKSDLLWQDPNTGDLLVWYMNGPTVSRSFATGLAAPLVRGIGDLDGDKRADVVFSVATTSSGPFSTDLQVVYFRARGTYLQDDLGTLPSSAWRVEQVADANGDGRAEIYVRNRQTGVFGLWWMTAPTPHLSSFVDIDTPRLDQEVQPD